MRRLFIFTLLAFAVSAVSQAQELIIPEGYKLVDSVIFKPAAVMDSTLTGRDVFSILPSRARGNDSEITVHQSNEIAAGMDAHILNNKDKSISGYRVRIYFDNKQNARSVSETVQNTFESKHPGITAYRSFVSPFFKVTVGDFRTKSEAMQLLQQISGEYPTAFVVKENIKYPIVDKNNTFIVDTVMVMRPLEGSSKK